MSSPPQRPAPPQAGFGSRMMGGPTPVAKIADFRGTTKRLLGMLRPDRVLMLMAIVFGIASVALAVIGPKILGHATDLIFSGIMERHPKLKIYMSHTGGVLPYQAGRLDKTTPQAGVGSFSRKSDLPHPPSTYIKRMYTDMVQPNADAMKFALKFFGIDHIIYGTDYPCWNPSIAMKLFNEIELPEADLRKIFHDNAKKFFALPEVPAQQRAKVA